MALTQTEMRSLMDSLGCLELEGSEMGLGGLAGLPAGRMLMMVMMESRLMTTVLWGESKEAKVQNLGRTTACSYIGR